MALDLYRRHLKTCSHVAQGKGFTRCACPVWVDGRHPDTGKRLRRSLETTDWRKAVRRLEAWEQGIAATGHVPDEGPELEEAIKLYLADCTARRLSPSTIRSYTKALAHFQALWTARHSSKDVSRVSVDIIAEFQSERSRADGRDKKPITTKTQRKELEAMRAFCEFLVNREWIKSNPARKVKAPRDTGFPTMPFTAEEVKKLIEACDRIDNNYGVAIERSRLRARALVLLLLYSGMRVGDAVKLERSRLGKDGRLLIRMMKTREPLYVRLQPAAIEALEAIAAKNGPGQYFFWSGTAKLSTAVGSARRTIECLGRLTEIAAHPHRFRDTFSVELLKNGTALRTVQLLLGHTSIHTTEKHYAPWVREFQEQLDKATSGLKFAEPS